MYLEQYIFCVYLLDILCVMALLKSKAIFVNLARSRVKFMLETIGHIRNNNVRKIPNYDPTHMEHLRKLLRNYTKGKITWHRSTQQDK